MTTSGTPNNNTSVQKAANITVANAGEYASPVQYNHAYKTRTKKLETVGVGTAESITARSTYQLTNVDTVVARFLTATEATTANGVFFIAKEDCKIAEVSLRFSTTSTSGTATLYKASSGTALGSGTAITNAVSIAGTANENVDGSLIANTISVAKGQALGIVFAGTVTNLVGLIVSVKITRLVP